MGQNLIDDFSSGLGLSMRGTLGGGRVLGWFLEREKPCEWNLTLGWKHLAVVILI